MNIIEHIGEMYVVIKTTTEEYDGLLMYEDENFLYCEETAGFKHPFIVGKKDIIHIEYDPSLI